MLLLSELNADPTDPRLKFGAEFMLQATQPSSMKWQSWLDNGVTCFWANLLRYALCFGFQDEDRIHAVIDILTMNASERNWRCLYNSWEPCAWGAVRTLWAFAALPEFLRSDAVLAAIQSAIHFTVEQYNPLIANYPVWKNGKISSLWFQLNFPLFYQADVLLLLRTMKELGRLDHPQIQPSLDWLRSQRKPDGRWSGVSPYRSRTWSISSDRAEPQRWISLHAALILKAAQD
jgi:hypothetical protein